MSVQPSSPRAVPATGGITSAGTWSTSERPRRVIILGSTGSIGTQALEVIAGQHGRFEVVGLAAGGGRPDIFAAQSAAHRGAALAVATSAAPDCGRPVRTGPQAATRLVEETDADVVLNGITGSIGLGPSLAALDAGRILALANKESLVAGGSLVTGKAAAGQIVPVDSEHSALAQCLRGGRATEVARLVLTASGGPFRGWPAGDLDLVTPELALKHPTWAMGPVVTVNSATLVNKGLELIEAHLLFGVPYAQIDTVVHPQSVIHSMVTFVDGSTLAQASPPDMRLPIALGLSWPDRLPGVASACDFSRAAEWTFEPVDHHAFPSLGLARAAGEVGGLLPAVYNAANEEAVTAFLGGDLPFPGIPKLLSGILEQADAWRAEPRDLSDVLEAEKWARSAAQQAIARTDRDR